MKPPLQLCIYKGITGKYGCIKFSPQAPYFHVKDNTKLRNYDGRFIKDSWKEKNPALTDNDMVGREGTLFMDITSAIDRNVYDWDNKIIFALNIWDMAKILTWLETGAKEELKLMHDPNAGSANKGQVQKFVKFSSPQGLGVGCTIQASQRNASGNNISHMVPVATYELVALKQVLCQCIPYCLGM